MKSRKTILVFAIAGFVAISVAVVSAQTPILDTFFKAGQSVSSVNANDRVGGQIVATVNGEAIYKDSFDRLKLHSAAMYEANMRRIGDMKLSEAEMAHVGDQRTDDELLDLLIEKTVKLQEAKRLDISVSEQEASDYLIANDKAISDAAPDEKALVESAMDAYISGLGLTYDEYRGTVGITVAKETLLFEKLAACLLGELGLGEDTPIDEQNKAISEYIDKLVSSAEIVKEPV